MPIPSHMALGPLKVLAARLLALPIFEPLSDRPVCAEVLRRFCSTVPEAQAQAATSLSDFLTQQLAVVEAYQNALTTAERAQVLPLLQELRPVVAGVACTVCAGPSGTPCTGRNGRRDDAQITHRGLCVALLHEIHDQLIPRLTKVITEWGRRESPALTPSLTHQWGTAWSGAARRLTASDPKVGGRTEIRDQGRPLSRYAEIQLEFAVDQFDWDSMLMIPWLFAHEFVCHVQQTPQSAAPREACRPSCVFLEGWMDELTFILIQGDFGAGWFGALPGGFLDLHRQDALDAARDYQRWRYGLPMGDQWQIGRDAARALIRFFEQTAPYESEANRRQHGAKELTALSFRIQAASPSTDELDEVVDRCLSAARRALRGDLILRARVLALMTSPIPHMSNWINELKQV